VAGGGLAQSRCQPRDASAMKASAMKGSLRRLAVTRPLWYGAFKCPRLPAGLRSRSSAGLSDGFLNHYFVNRKNAKSGILTT